MPRTVDHIVEMYQLAQNRKANGQPVWHRKINLSGVFHNNDLTFEQRRDAIVQILRATAWMKERAERDACGGLGDIVDNLACAEDTEEFDGWWDELYDEADRDRVWITTR
jgi:hypothetical protein